MDRSRWQRVSRGAAGVTVALVVAGCGAAAIPSATPTTTTRPGAAVRQLASTAHAGAHAKRQATRTVVREVTPTRAAATRPKRAVATPATTTASAPATAGGRRGAATKRSPAVVRPVRHVPVATPTLPASDMAHPPVQKARFYTPAPAMRTPVPTSTTPATTTPAATTTSTS
jgi:hypothetical protein